MKEFARLQPGQPVPPLRVKTVGGPCWRLCDQKPKHFTLVVFYGGYHCLFCERQLKEIEANYERFCKLGVRVLAVSADTRERAELTAEEWGLDKLTLCWGLTMDQARAWGLYISRGRGRSSRGIDEPAFFTEPAVFFVRPDGTLHSAIVQSMPIARPRLEDLLHGIEYVLSHNVGPRGDSDGIAGDAGPAEAAAPAGCAPLPVAGQGAA